MKAEKMVKVMVLKNGEKKVHWNLLGAWNG